MQFRFIGCTFSRCFMNYKITNYINNLVYIKFNARSRTFEIVAFHALMVIHITPCEIFVHKSSSMVLEYTMPHSEIYFSKQFDARDSRRPQTNHIKIKLPQGFAEFSVYFHFLYTLQSCMYLQFHVI
jgi:hypothetical protein